MLYFTTLDRIDINLSVLTRKRHFLEWLHIWTSVNGSDL